MRNICAPPHEAAWQVYNWIRYAVDPRFRVSTQIADCSCCAYWRGVVSGLAVAALVAAVALCAWRFVA